jgi:hypothetical protein
MKTKQTGRYGPWEPMRGARRQAEAIQEEKETSKSSQHKSKAYKTSVKNPSGVKLESLKQSRNAARKGLSRGSSPHTPDNY